MKQLFVVLAATCIIAVHSSPMHLDHHESRGLFHEAAADTACTSAKLLQDAGWFNSDGTMARQFHESEAAKECRNLVGNNPCDTSDRILSCMGNKGLMTAVHLFTLPAHSLPLYTLPPHSLPHP